MILAGLAPHALFMSSALPLKVFPPMFNRYTGGGHFGTHVDTAIRAIASTGQRIRTDLSATLFFSAPDEYDGGELLVEDTYGLHSVKLPPGHLVLYPATSLHRVAPVTRGARVASFFWIQSMIRADADRTLLYDLDTAIQRLARDRPGNPAGVQLAGVYHNLLAPLGGDVAPSRFDYGFTTEKLTAVPGTGLHRRFVLGPADTVFIDARF